MSCSKINPIIIRIFPKDDIKFAVCGSKGTIIFYNIKDKTSIYANDPEELGIEDGQWHPAENYFIASYCDGRIKLFEGFKETETLIFDRQGTVINNVNWVHDTSGDFISGLTL